LDRLGATKVNMLKPCNLHRNKLKNSIIMNQILKDKSKNKFKLKKNKKKVTQLNLYRWSAQRRLLG
jgi:hypothetical protein